MKTKVFLSILAFGVIVSAFGQNTIELTFTAIDSADYELLDSIKVMNLTQGSDTILIYPDTALVLDYQVGISETKNSTKGLQIFQNYPNPVVNKTTISFYVPERDNVRLIVTDILGSVLINTERILDQGYHSYLFTPGDGNLFLFTVLWRGNASSIKIFQINYFSKNTSSLDYMGRENSSQKLKVTEAIQSFLFNIGDKLLYIGYTGTLQSGMLDIPETSETHTFQFATNIPCLGTPTVTYGGQVYNTIQIFSQCWLKENLHVGAMILGGQQMTDNDTIEKYCYNNELDSCAKYGGLYQWNEMLQYSSQKGVQGICPPGWHLPTDVELKVLEGAVDSLYGIGDNTWNGTGVRGFDAGTNLKTTSGWYSGGNGTDMFGFSGLSGGGCTNGGSFYDVGNSGYWWTSSEIAGDNAFYRGLGYNYPGVFRHLWSPGGQDSGLSARCLRDE